MKNIITGILVIGALGIIVFAGYQYFFNPEPSIRTDREFIDEEINESPDSGITVSDILENPEMYEGAEVTVRAEVEEWLNPRAFVLDGQGVVQDNLLIITRDPTYAFEDPELFGDDIWEVTGTVERFTVATAIDTYDVDLQADAFAIYEGKPYLVADTVTLFED